jgi:hypothetical protein
MLSRPATKISLTTDDLMAFEQRRQAREAAKAREAEAELAATAAATKTDDEDLSEVADLTPAAQAKATRSRVKREQRIGVSNSRG